MIVSTDEMKRACRSLGLDESHAKPKMSFHRERAEVKWSDITGGERDQLAAIEAMMRKHMGIPAPRKPKSTIRAWRAF